jgi:hypothetical protein
MALQASALERLTMKARKRAAARGIRYATAYAQILAENPRLYEAAMEEKADAAITGASMDDYRHAVRASTPRPSL